MRGDPAANSGYIPWARVPGALPQPRTLAALALLAGVLQILATVNLGMAPVRALESASAEGAQLYVLTVAAIVGTLWLAWSLRGRPLLAAAVFVGAQAALFWPLFRRLSRLGIALHGETMLHHFIAALCAAVIVKLCASWTTQERLARWGTPVFALAAGGTVLLLGAHVFAATGRPPRWTHPWGAGLLIASWPVALAVTWRHAANRRLWGVAAALLVPLAVRIGAAWPESLSGGPVDPQQRPLVMGSVVAAALVVFFLFRPRLEPKVRLVVATISGIATAGFYTQYRQGFGELEDGIDGLTRSLFGFNIPYPTYVGAFEVLTVAVAICLILYVVYVALVSTEDRRTGLALGLMAITGIGLTTPQLVLMDAAGLLLLLDQALVDDPGEVESRGPRVDMEAVFATAAARVGLPEPLTLETQARPVIALRGDLQDVIIDARARSKRAGWSVDITVGVPGRGRGDLVLAPGRPSEQLHHRLAETHSTRGDVRLLESDSDQLLDALLPFPGVRAEFWGAGVKIDLGGDLANLDGDGLAALVLAARDHVGPDA